MGILMVNFVIAILSATYTFMEEHGNIITKIQRMCTVAVVEFRIPRCLKGMQEYLKRRHFIVEDGHVFFTYVHQIQPKDISMSPDEKRLLNVESK